MDLIDLLRLKLIFSEVFFFAKKYLFGNFLCDCFDLF